MRLFQSFESFIQSRSCGYAPSFNFPNPRKIRYIKIHQPNLNSF